MYWCRVLQIVVGVVGSCPAVTDVPLRALCRNAYYVGTMAKATDRFQRTSMRANYLYRCSLPEFAGFEVCSKEDIKRGLEVTQKNIDHSHYYHHQLFLGSNKLETFKDPRLLVRSSG
jgi:hypothetical protein